MVHIINETLRKWILLRQWTLQQMTVNTIVVGSIGYEKDSNRFWLLSLIVNRKPRDSRVVQKRLTGEKKFSDCDKIETTCQSKKHNRRIYL